MDTVRSHGSSRYAVEYDAFGQVIVSEGTGSRYSVRSQGSAGADGKSGHAPADNALQSLASGNGTAAGRQTNGTSGLPPTSSYYPITPGQFDIRSLI